MRSKTVRRALFGCALALLGAFDAAVAQTTCRGYVTQAPFGSVCAWGCGGDILCNCTAGACADGTTIKM